MWQRLSRRCGRGRFKSLNDAITEAARLLLRELAEESGPAKSVQTAGAGQDPILGLTRNDTDLMDEIVANAYRQRPEETWRELGL